MQFVDTNIFLRHLTKDDPVKAQACFELFQKAQRKEVVLTTSESVIAEVVYVLSSKQIYKLPREEVRKLLYPILSLRGLKLPRRKIFFRALDLYAFYSLNFEDALTIAQMERQKIKELYSYDEEFDDVASVKRLEP